VVAWSSAAFGPSACRSFRRTIHGLATGDKSTAGSSRRPSTTDTVQRDGHTGVQRRHDGRESMISSLDLALVRCRCRYAAAGIAWLRGPSIDRLPLASAADRVRQLAVVARPDQTITNLRLRGDQAAGRTRAACLVRRPWPRPPTSGREQRRAPRTSAQRDRFRRRGECSISARSPVVAGAGSVAACALGPLDSNRTLNRSSASMPKLLVR